QGVDQMAIVNVYRSVGSRAGERLDIGLRLLHHTWLGESRRIVEDQHAWRSGLKILRIGWGWGLPYAGIDVVAKRIDAYAMSVPPRTLHAYERGYRGLASRGGKDADDRKGVGYVFRAIIHATDRVRARAGIPATHIGIKGLDIGASDLRKSCQDVAVAQVHQYLRGRSGAPYNRRVGQRIDIDPAGIAPGGWEGGHNGRRTTLRRVNAQHGSRASAGDGGVDKAIDRVKARL